MKYFAALCFSALLLAGCATNPTTVTPPTTGTNSVLIESLDTVEVLCEAGAPFAGAIGSIIAAACPPFVNGAINIIEANGTAATMNAIFATLKSELATIPGFGSNSVIAGILNGAQAIINIFEGGAPTPVTASARATSTVGVNLSAAEKAYLEGIRVRAGKIKAGK